MDIFQSLLWRYATKTFDSSKKKNDQDFQKILDAIILTASSFGLQPWKFVIVKNPEIRESLKAHSWGQSQIVDASHLMVFCRTNTIDESYIQKFIKKTAQVRGQELGELDVYKNLMVENLIQGRTEEQREQWARNQVYIALGNAMTIAASMGIDTCPIEGFSTQKYDEILRLTEKGVSSCVVLALGYRSENDKYANSLKVRFNKQDLVEEIL